MADQVVKAILRYEVDRAAQEKTLRSIRELVDAQKAFETKVNAVGSGADRVGALRSRFADTRVEVQGARDAVEKLRAEVLALDKVRVSPTIDVRGAGVGANVAASRSIGQTITAAGRGLFNAPDVGGSTVAARALIAGGAAVDKLGISAAGLAAVAPVAAVGLTAVAVAFDRFNQEIKASKAYLDAGISASDAYYNALRENTTQQVRDQVAQLQRTAPIIEAQLNELKAARESAFEQFSAGFTDAGARILDRFGVTTTTQLTERIEELQAEFDSTNLSIVRLNQGLEAQAFSENDLARIREDATTAMQRLMQAEEQAAEQRLRQRIQQDAELRGFERTATPEALTSRLQLLEDERQALEAAMPLLTQRRLQDEQSFQTWKDSTLRLAELTREFKRLNEAVTPASIQRFDTALDAEILDITTRRDAAIKNADKELADAQIENERRKNDALNKLATEQADKELKIRRDFGRTAGIAIANRDTVAFALAKQQRDDQLADLKLEGKRRTEELDSQLKEQNRVAEKRHRQAIDTARTAATAEINARRAAANQILADLYSALNAQVAMHTSASNAMRALAQNGLDYYNMLRQVVANGPVVQPNVVNVPQTGTAFQNFLRYQNSQNAFIPDPRQVYPSFDVGAWRIKEDMLARVHKDEMIVPAAVAAEIRRYSERPTEPYFARPPERMAPSYNDYHRSGGGSPPVNVNINLSGKTIRGVSREQAIRVLTEVFDDAGVR